MTAPTLRRAVPGRTHRGGRRDRHALNGLLLMVVVMVAGGVPLLRIAVVAAVVALTGVWAHRRRSLSGVVRFVLPVIIGLGQVTQSRFGGDALASPVRDGAIMAVAGLAFIVGCVSAQRVSDAWRVWLPAALAAVSIMLLPLVPGIGARSADGAAVSAVIAGQSVIPAEFARVLLLVAAAAVLAETGRVLVLPPRRVGRLPVPDPRALLPLAVAFLLTGLLLLMSKDMGPLLVIALTLLVLIWAAGGRWMWTAVGGFGVVLGLFTLGLAVGKVRSRILALWQPPGTGTAAQDQLARARWAVAEGGIAGGPPGRSSPSFVYVANADGVVAAWAQLVGLVGIIATAALVGTLVAAVLRQARHAPAFQHLTAVAMMTAWALQLLMLAASTVGVFPLVGVSAPPFTTGGSELVAWALALGLAVGGAHLAPRGAGRVCTALAVPPRDARVAVGLGVVTVLVLGAFVNVSVLSRKEIISQPGNPREALAFTGARGRILDRVGRPLAEDGARHRLYADPAVTSVVGVLSVQTGATGLESALGEELRCGGRRFPFTGCRPKDVTTTLDLGVQKAADAALRRTDMDGEVLVMDLTGEIRAWAVTPALDGQAFLGKSGSQRVIDVERSPARAGLRGITEQRMGTPGSVSKLVTALAAVEDHVSVRGGLGTAWTAPDGSVTVRNANRAECPGATLRSAIAHSCNTAFADLAVRVGPSALVRMSAALGLADPTEVAPGLIVPAARTVGDAQQGDRAAVNAALGADPARWGVLHAAVVGATIANGGLRVHPRLVAADELERDQVVPAEVAAVVADGMRAAVAEGTARSLAGSATAVMAKTGTAADGAGRAEPWIVAVAGPAGRQVVVAVHLRPAPGASGGATAAPVAAEVLRASR